MHLDKAPNIAKAHSLKSQVYKASAWLLSGFGIQKLLQLASNLILTRILFPEAFGLMAIVNVFLVGLQMLSDIGIKPAIVQAKDPIDTNYLNTAWTMQVIRGFFLWLSIVIIAFPASVGYGEPLLLPLLCFTGFNACILGFQSINVILTERKMDIKRIMFVRLSAQIVTIGTMIVLALATKSVWALAIGTACGALFEILLGHAYFKGHRHQFAFDRQHAQQIFRFGKWIFVSTLFSYFGGQGARAFEAAFVSTKDLAMIAIAGTIAWMLIDLIMRLMANITFPTLSKINREKPEDFSRILHKLRSKIILLTLPAFGLLAVSSNLVIDILYDDRYALAGPILSILAITGAIRTIPLVYQNALLAIGDSRKHSLIVAVSSSLNVVFLIAGFEILGILGMLLGTGAAYVVGYLVAAFQIRKAGWISLKADMLSFALIIVFGVTGAYINVLPYITKIT